ncbi:unnamed protein product [Caenorhabditis bovis]|uniref:DUF7596 domain-containing protein n=1 Tax=Caenorhabditis bovis TaxID=2654633 RepID=A0A8S1EIB9_9PELO|nr:unnamed protein product [Caenorhabditis bovis]
MLHTPSLVKIVNNSLPYKSLKESFLPVNNNAEYMSFKNVVTATIMDENEPIAFGSIIKCNEKQAYVMLGEVAERFQNKSVWIESVESENKTELVYKITKCVDLLDYSGRTLFEQIFENRDEKTVHLHLLDKLIDTAVGTEKLDNVKNITVDFERGSNCSSWRDVVGFVVSDKYLFSNVTLNRFELLALQNEQSEIVIQNVSKEKLHDIFDYDSTVSLFDREGYLENLLNTSGVFVKIAKSNEIVSGMVVFTKNSILMCYGDNDEVQKALLAASGSEMQSGKVSMFIRNDSNNLANELLERALETVPITRLNTRIVVNTIKWNKIACLNMGLHLY